MGRKQSPRERASSGFSILSVFPSEPIAPSAVSFPLPSDGTGSVGQLSPGLPRHLSHSFLERRWPRPRPWQMKPWAMSGQCGPSPWRPKRSSEYREEREPLAPSLPGWVLRVPTSFGSPPCSCLRGDPAGRGSFPSWLEGAQGGRLLLWRLCYSTQGHGVGACTLPRPNSSFLEPPPNPFSASMAEGSPLWSRGLVELSFVLDWTGNRPWAGVSLAPPFPLQAVFRGGGSGQPPQHEPGDGHCLLPGALQRGPQL